MLNLILKDFNFNKKQIGLGFVIVIVLAIGMSYFGDGSKNMYISYTMSEFIICFYCITKNFYIEEKDKTIHFLKILPVKIEKIVASKFIEIICYSITSLLLVLILNLIFEHAGGYYFILPINYSILIIIISITYSSIFATMFFKKDYSFAYNSIYLMFISMIAILFLIAKFGGKINYININMNIIISMIVIGAILINIILYKFSIKYYKNKTI